MNTKNTLPKRILVEGVDDAKFIYAFCQHLNIPNVDVEHIEVIPINGLFNLNDKLNTARKAAKKNLTHLGILIDYDKYNQSSRLNYINEELKEANFIGNLSTTQIFADFTSFDFVGKLKIACDFIGLNGKGCLEDLLWNIKTQSSPFADNLQCWRDCAEKQQKKISDSIFKKEQVDFYVKYDGAADKNLSNYTEKYRPLSNMYEKPELFDFDSSALSGLRRFLNLFK